MKRVSSWLGALLIACSFLPRFAAAQGVEPAHFHHVHLNVTNPQKTIDFYKKYFGVVEVKYHGTIPALFAERTFFLLSKVDAPPPFAPKSALSHIGWSTVDAQSSYEWLKKAGIEFETPIGQLGNDFGMYIYGPDKELVELWTGSRNHRFEHIHLWATSVDQTAKWFKDNLGIQGRVGPKPTITDHENILALQMAFLQSDNVNLIIFGRPSFDSRWWPGGSYKKEDGPPGPFETTKGRAIDHIAFSYRDIAPVFERMKAAGVEIVAPIEKSKEFGHTSFFVMGPDKLVIEIVQEKPIPEGIWD